MTAEVDPQVDLNVLPIKDLARQARREIEVVGNEINDAQSPVSRAIRNIGIIDRIRESEAVQAYLKSTKTIVHLLGYGLNKGKTGIIISTEGYSLRWLAGQTNDGMSWHSSAFITGNEEIIRDYNNGSPKIKGVIERLAKLEPEQIVKKFEKAVSKPIKVK